MSISKEVDSPRCQLYNLEPIGIGTRYVESLASYMSRLATIHSVSFTRMLRELLKKELYYEIRTPRNINGQSENTKKIVNNLEKKTLRSDIKDLTMLSWENILGEYYFYKTRVWCPVCYQEWFNNNEIIYDPLFWSFNEVKACPKHRVFLETRCPNCLKEQKIGKYYRPGFCALCGSWLGVDIPEKQRTAPIFYSEKKCLPSLTIFIDDL